MHTTIISFSLGTAIAGLPLKLYNDSITWCWIASVPRECSGNIYSPQTGCDRGDNALAYRWAFLYIPLWLSIFLVTVSMITMYYYVRREERASARWRRSNDQESLASQVFWQALFYILSFYLTWIFPTVHKTMQTFGADVPFAMPLLQGILLPMQGLMNSLVYVRPRFVKYLKRNPSSTLGNVIRRTLLVSISCQCCCKNMAENEKLKTEAEAVQDANDLDPAHEYRDRSTLTSAGSVDSRTREGTQMARSRAPKDGSEGNAESRIRQPVKFARQEHQADLDQSAQEEFKDNSSV